MQLDTGHLKEFEDNQHKAVKIAFNALFPYINDTGLYETDLIKKILHKLYNKYVIQLPKIFKNSAMIGKVYNELRGLTEVRLNDVDIELIGTALEYYGVYRASQEAIDLSNKFSNLEQENKE